MTTILTSKRVNCRFFRGGICAFGLRVDLCPLACLSGCGLCGVDNCAACNHSNKTMQCKPCLLYP